MSALMRRSKQNTTIVNDPRLSIPRRMIPEGYSRRDPQLDPILASRQRLHVASDLRIAVDRKARVEQVVGTRVLELELVRTGVHLEGEIVGFGHECEHVFPSTVRDFVH